ncbi:MAG TPA: hypothetical protein VN618_12440 [Solirubrobacteraceae bacterium]|nr:hypothetical protein [Solirubrobacteraceae bacterium]
MSEQRPDRAAARGRRGRRRNVRLGVLLVILAAAVAVLILRGGNGSDRSPASACASESAAPEVRSVRPSELSKLREELDRLVPDRIARLYEEGTVSSTAAWNDQEPAPPAVSPTARRPDAYEMRWWAPNGDDVVGDIFVFADAGAAKRYLALATSTRCRSKASRALASTTPEAVNLSWLNPDGAAQADVYFARGPRVYRLADAPAGQHGGEIRPGSLAHAFATLDVLGCLLPGARCRREGKSAVPA